MTGISLPWRMNKETKERYYKYVGRLFSMLLIVGGASLMLEHLFKYEGFDIELFGHEIYGLLMIGAGFLIALKWEQLPPLIKAIKAKDWIAILDQGAREKYKQVK